MQKIQFDYFTGMEAEQYSFYRVPKVLFTEPCFKTLSCEAKVLYGLMLDRMSLSIKNRWLDSEDRVYIIFTVEEIAELMNCGTQKAVKLVKELDSNNGIGLIEKKRLGLGKPNVIYVKNFMLREVPDQKPMDSCADLQSEQKNYRKCADLQSEQGNHEECANLQSEAENREKTGTFLNCENHHSGVVKSTIQDCVESQLQNGENHNSGMMKTTNQEFPESQFQNCNQSAGVIIGDTSIDFDTLLPDLESRLEAMDIGPLLGLWFQTLVVGLTMNILSICIFLVTYGRMIEIYAVTALGPIPLATLGNAEWRGMGQNYLKSLLALGFQAFLIMVVVGIYAVLIQQIGTADDISGAIWGCMGYTVLLCFCLFKTGSISKAVFTAH